MEAARTRTAAGGPAHTRVIFDRHAKLPIVSGSVPMTSGPAVPVHHNVARPRLRASANRPHPDREGTSRRRSWPCSSTATSRPRSRSRRLQAKSQRQWQTHPAGTRGGAMKTSL
jgi:hypothetical protein